jgi:hypothetical protein
VPATALPISDAGLAILLAAIILLFLLFISPAVMVFIFAASVCAAAADPAGVSATAIGPIVVPFLTFFAFAFRPLSLFAAFG